MHSICAVVRGAPDDDHALARAVVEAPGLARRIDVPSADDLAGVDAADRRRVVRALAGLAPGDRLLVTRADPAFDGAPWTRDMASAILAARLAETR